MNNPNPFVPQGSLLELQSKRRSRLKLGVFCVLIVGIAGLAAMLIQGCKREESENSPDQSQSQPPVDTNNYAASDTNPPSMEASNPPVGATPPGQTVATPPPPPTPVAPPPAPAESEYVVVKGDTLGKIAKANGVTLKALEDANSGVTPTRLKVGQKLVIPAGASTTGATTAAETASGVSASGGEAYTVKSGDTLTRIAHHFGVTVKAIMTENNLTTTHIKVGEKLNIPAKPEAVPDVNAAPATATPPPPSEPMPSAPAPSTPPPPPPSGTAQ
jgi:LysM repeat protein